MSMAITTRYIGPSNTRGSRIKATGRKAETWGDKRMPELSITDSYASAQSSEENHCRVAHLCAAKLNWAGLYVGGGLPEGTGWAFVCVTDADLATVARMADALEQSGKREGRDFFIQPRNEEAK